MSSNETFRQAARRVGKRDSARMINRARELYREVRRSLRKLGFSGNPQSYYLNSIIDYGGENRVYHGFPHGRFMIPVRNEEIEGLREFLKTIGIRLSKGEENFLRAIHPIAAARHDKIYLGVDGGYRTAQMPYLTDYVDINGPPYRVTIKTPPSENSKELLRLVNGVFGFKTGETIAELPTTDSSGKQIKGGANEYLSAITAVHDLVAPDLAKGHRFTRRMKDNVIAIAALIEATIPFRAEMPEKLYDRLRELRVNEPRATLIVMAAVLLANRDVEGFCGGPIDKALTAEQRFQHFVAGTWELLPENSATLRQRDYSPADYLASLRKNHFFVTQVINRNAIFHSFRGFPPPAEMEIRQKHVDENLGLLDKYMTAKIASASIVEALSKLLDEGVSRNELVVAKLVGGMKDILPPPVDTEANFKGDDAIVYNTLRERTEGELARGFDIRESPIARYLMQKIGWNGIEEIVKAANNHMPVNNPLATQKAKDQGANYNLFLQEVERIAGKDVFNTILAGMREVALRQADKIMEPKPDEWNASAAVFRHRAGQFEAWKENGIPPRRPNDNAGPARIPPSPAV